MKKPRDRARRREQWARHAAELEGEFETFVDRGAGVQVVKQAVEGGPAAAVVWSPVGAGRLRFARPVRGGERPPLREGGLELNDTYLTLDDVPLLLWRQSACPSCEQLVRAAVARPAGVREATAALRSLTTQRLRQGVDAAVPAPGWLFALLPAGLYLVSLDDYAPTPGDDRCAWGAFHDVERCDALRLLFPPSPPHHLLPTQRLSGFREDARARAADAFRTHPGLALYVGGVASALLDGHHRALAAAERRERFSCITVTAATVHSLARPPGTPCGAPATRRVVFEPRGVSLAEHEWPEPLRRWLAGRATLPGPRWVWERATVDAFDEQLAAAAPPPPPPGAPRVDVAGAYATWRALLPPNGE